MDQISKFLEPLMETQPVVAFDFNNSPYLGGTRRSRKKFVTYVDNSLKRNLPEHEDQKKFVQFCLAIETLDSKLKDSDVVDRWINMVMKHHVTEFKLNIRNAPEAKYQFPPDACDVGHLVVLALNHCMLKRAFIQEEDTMFQSILRLKEIRLRHVDFTEVAVGELLSRCPLLETLKLHSCRHTKHLDLCDFPNLKNVELWNISENDDDIFTYKIDSPYLESLLYLENGKPMDLEAVSCNNLKKLHVVTHGSNITDKYIKETCSKFPLLEELILNAKSFGSKHVDCYNLSLYLVIEQDMIKNSRSICSSK